MKVFFVFCVLFLNGAYFPFYIILPFFTDVNSVEMADRQDYFYCYCYIPSKFLFDAFFTGQFLRAVNSLRTEVVTDTRLLVISYKSIVHTLVRKVACVHVCMRV